MSNNDSDSSGPSPSAAAGHVATCAVAIQANVATRAVAIQAAIGDPFFDEPHDKWEVVDILAERTVRGGGLVLALGHAGAWARGHFGLQRSRWLMARCPPCGCRRRRTRTRTRACIDCGACVALLQSKGVVVHVFLGHPWGEGSAGSPAMH